MNRRDAGGTPPDPAARGKTGLLRVVSRTPVKPKTTSEHLAGATRHRLSPADGLTISQRLPLVRPPVSLLKCTIILATS